MTHFLEQTLEALFFGAFLGVVGVGLPLAGFAGVVWVGERLT